MNTYRIRQLGTEEPSVLIEAHNATMAVAEAAGCDWTLVCLPIWETFGGPRWATRPTESCYMPRDGSGRQWVVTYPQGA